MDYPELHRHYLKESQRLYKMAYEFGGTAPWKKGKNTFAGLMARRADACKRYAVWLSKLIPVDPTPQEAKQVMLTLSVNEVYGRTNMNKLFCDTFGFEPNDSIFSDMVLVSTSAELAAVGKYVSAIWRQPVRVIQLDEKRQS